MLVVGLQSYVSLRNAITQTRSCAQIHVVGNKLSSMSWATAGLNFINDSKADETEVFQQCLLWLINSIFLIKKYAYGLSP